MGGLTDGLLILVMTGHLLVVHVVTAAPFLALALEIKATRSSDPLAEEVGRRLARHALFGLALGVVLGFGLLSLVVWINPQYWDSLRQVPGRGMWAGVSERIWSTLVELVIFAVTMGAYLALWSRWPKQGGWKKWTHRGLAVFAGTNLWYHLPPLFAVVAVIHERQTWNLEQTKYIRILSDPEVLARVLHSWLAALVVGGVWLILLAWQMDRRGRSADAARVARWGAFTALVPALAQVLAGSLLLFSLPPATQHQLMGGDWLLSGLLGAAVLVSLALMHHLASIALGDTEAGPLLRSTLLLILIILLMVSVRHLSRSSSWTETPTAALHSTS